MFHQELNLNDRPWSKQDDIRLVGREREVNVVLKHGNARVFKHHGMALNVLYLQANRVFSRSDAGVVRVREIPDQSIVVKFEIVVFEILLKNDIGSVWGVHDEVDLFDVLSSESVSNLNGELHLSEIRTVVGRPFKLLRVVPVASEGLVAAVDANARTRKGVGHDLKSGIAT